MQQEQILRFGPYRLDLRTPQLWRGTQEVKATPKALAVLCALVARHGQVVTKEELFQTVWPGTAVSDAALTSCIQELRQALRDNPRQPRYLETVHRRGFRFIALLSITQPVPSPKSQVPSQHFQPAPSTQHPAPTLVGREPELWQLHHWLEKALQGERQVVFVTGEPGIGKTTLVEAFLAQVGAGLRACPLPGHSQGGAPTVTLPDLWIAHGQCIEHYGAGEAYLPLLEALGRLCRAPGSEQLLALLTQHAPTWLVQMPALLSATELEALQRKVAGATKERMLRELAEALEALTAEQPLVLWLEDLHWSDMSTLDWLAFVARRRERARLVVLGTYRPVDVLAREHPLKAVKQELQLHGQCQELPLDFLTEEHVAEYLATRFGVGAVREPPLRGLAGIIHQRTDGNPLFMVNVVDALITRGIVTSSGGQWELTNGVEQMVVGIPDNLQQMIEQRLAQMSPAERTVLEVASVAGAEFSAAAVAAGVETSIEAVEKQCEELVRRKLFLRTCGTDEWPDGTVATRYGFLHALYQEVLYERLPAGRRQRLHRQIGEREEAAYGERAREIAAELAVHFERGRDYRRAIQYLQQAGENAIRRSANQEAISLLTKGLELLRFLPDTPERIQQELTLQITLGTPLAATKGWAAPEVGKIYTRTRELCQQVGETPQLFPVLYGLWGFYVMRAELQTAWELGDQLLTLAQNVQDPALLLQVHYALGVTLFSLGELVPARAHLEQSLALYDPQKSRSYAVRTIMSRVTDLTTEALVLWLLGYPEQGLQKDHEALTLAQELAHPQSLAIALVNGGWLHQYRREGQAAQARAEAAIALSTEQGFAQLLALGTIQRGWALTEQGQGEEGIVQLRQGLAAYRATGAELYRSDHLALLVEAHEKAGQREEGLAVLAEALALVDKTGERFYEAELYRLKGTLTLQSQTSPKQVEGQSKASRGKSAVTNPQHLTPSTQAEAEAEACFHKAIEIARKQQAKSWELRAATSLAHLWQQQGKKKQAHKMLAEIYGWFTEGFDTADLKEAAALLGELG